MKINEPGSHIDHMLRQTRMHHVQLSSMADLKANMLVTMASVLITLSVPYTMQADFKLVAFVLICFCLLTIVLAAYSAMPKLPFSTTLKWGGKSSHWDFNLLFFGDFGQLSYEDYEIAMEEVMNDPSRTYQVQVKEIYTLGKFLVTKKYRFLRLAYISFITGLFATGLLTLFRML